MFHELLNISQTAPGRYQFIAKLEREITHPLGVFTHTRKLLIFKGILYICGNQLHKLGLFKIKSSPPKFIHDLLKFFGDISYSIYLLHPIVYTITGIIFYQINKYILLDNYVRIITSVLITIALSRFVYLYFEKSLLEKVIKLALINSK
jgi:hypothetical protein